MFINRNKPSPSEMLNFRYLICNVTYLLIPVCDPLPQTSMLLPKDL